MQHNAADTMRPLSSTHTLLAVAVAACTIAVGYLRVWPPPPTDVSPVRDEPPLLMLILATLTAAAAVGWRSLAALAPMVVAAVGSCGIHQRRERPRRRTRRRRQRPNGYRTGYMASSSSSSNSNSNTTIKAACPDMELNVRAPLATSAAQTKTPAATSSATR